MWRYIVYVLLAAALILPIALPLGLPFGDEIPNLAGSTPTVQSMPSSTPSSGKMPPPGMMSSGGKTSPHGKMPPSGKMPPGMKMPPSSKMPHDVMAGKSEPSVDLPALTTPSVPRPLPPDMKQNPVERLYRAVDSLPAGAIILLGVDFTASSQAEMIPLLENLARHVLRGQRRLLLISLYDQGPLLSMELLNNTAIRYNARYGKDWALLGTIPGEETALLRFGRDMRSVFSKDIHGNSIESLPIMQEVNSVAGLSLAIDLSDGEGTPVSYVKMLGSSGLPIGAALTARAAPGLMPYVQSGQILGLAAGLPGAAHYEKLGGEQGPLHTALDALSLGGALILVLILIGNFISIRKV